MEILSTVGAITLAVSATALVAGVVWVILTVFDTRDSLERRTEDWQRERSSDREAYWKLWHRVEALEKPNDHD